MLSFVEIVISCIGFFGIFTTNLLCMVIGLVGIIICDLLDVFIMKQNPGTLIFACMFAIGVSIANNDVLYSFTISLCGESLILSILGFFMFGINSLKKRNIENKGEKDKASEIRSNLFQLLNYNNTSDLDKYIELSKIVMKKLGTENIDEAIEKSYGFYKEQGIKVEEVQIDENNKFTTLSKLVMLGLGCDNIDEALQQTKEFYNNQKEEEVK